MLTADHRDSLRPGGAVAFEVTGADLLAARAARGGGATGRGAAGACPVRYALARALRRYGRVTLHVGSTLAFASVHVGWGGVAWSDADSWACYLGLEAATRNLIRDFEYGMYSLLRPGWHRAQVCTSVVEALETGDRPVKGVSG